MSTNTKRGRRPSKFYRGRIPNTGIHFIQNQNTKDLREIQKNYHVKFGHWLRETTIASTLGKKTQKKSVVLNTKSNKITVSVNYKGKSYTPLEYLDEREKEAKFDLFTALNG
tara:strand:+ start:418 stop:753 length:336 start_codon:yes stop_codon:yes gene_type:complete